MPLTTALYTGLSGLTVNQVALDVIGNNIANVNTYAFKGSRAMFQPQFSETMNFGSAPGDVYGGSNPVQKGLGAIASGIQRNFSDGNIKPTQAGDLAIEGDGLFVLDGPERAYTRNGAFAVNSADYMVSADGRYVMGYGVDTNYSIVPGRLERIRIPKGLNLAQVTTRMELKGMLKTSGDLATAGTVLESDAMKLAGGGAVLDTTHLIDVLNADDEAMFSLGETLTFAGSRGGAATSPDTLLIDVNTTVGDLMGMMMGSLGVNTAPGIPNPAGATVRDLGGGQYAMQITGNVGSANALTASFTTTSASGIAPGFSETQAAVGEGVYFSQTVYDSLGSKVQLGLTFTYESKNVAGGTTWRFFASSPDDMSGNSVVGMGTIDFDADGNFVSSTGASASINRAGSGARTPLTVNLDMSNMQGLNSAQPRSVVYMLSQDGNEAGEFRNYSISEDGLITGSFSNGDMRTLGQIAVATFSNYTGLVDAGNNTFIPGPNSGGAAVGTATTNGAGRIKDGALETSNVDISTEFVNLITTSAGFSASSRVITTANTLLTELLSIMR